METTETPQKTPPQSAPLAEDGQGAPAAAQVAPALQPQQTTHEPPKLVEMHQAPADVEHPSKPVAADAQPTKKDELAQNSPHAHPAAIASHGPHRPIGVILLIVMAMVILSGLAILVYLNS